MKRIERKSYLDWLIRWKDRQIIKVVTGVRRCGKSTLFVAFQDHLLSQGIRPEQIISINFEDLSYVELTEAEKLYHYIIERLSKSGRNYVFLDEIQHVRNFE